MIDIKTQRLPCRILLKDRDGFLAYSANQGKDSLRYARQICVLKSIRVWRRAISVNGVVVYDTAIQAEDLFDTIGLSEEEVNLFFELDIPRDIL